MGSGFAIIPIMIIVTVIVLIGLGVMVAGRRSQARVGQMLTEHETLRYRVPEGIDPAALIVALRHEGYQAAPAEGFLGEDLLIACPGGVDRHRAEVRATLQHATDLQGRTTSPPLVRFVDELPPGSPRAS